MLKDVVTAHFLKHFHATRSFTTENFLRHKASIYTAARDSCFKKNVNWLDSNVSFNSLNYIKKSREHEKLWKCEVCEYLNRKPFINEKGHRYFFLDALRCRNCQALCNRHTVSINPQHPEDIATIFNVRPVRFKIPLNVAKQEYLRLQCIVHPDRFAHYDKKIHEHATIWSALLSQCYTNINDPLRWGEILLDYLKSVNGTEASNQSNSQDFELFSEIFDIESRSETLSNEQEANRLHSKISKKLALALISLERTFLENDLQHTEKILHRCQMLNSVKKRIEQKIAALQRGSVN